MRRSLQFLSKMSLAPAMLTFVPGSFAFGQVNTSTAFQKIDAYLQDQTAKSMFRGSALVGIDGKIVFEKDYGFANQEWNAKNTPTTKFHIASLTKQFTATWILLLQERHQLQVSDPISKCVPHLPPTWQNITLHQLLTHTSGIPNYAEMPKVDQILNRTGATLRELVDLAATKPLEFRPGTQLHYINTGYTLLGMVIEKVSGMSYADFLEKNIFVPLGMKDSGYDVQSKIAITACVRVHAPEGPNRQCGFYRHESSERCRQHLFHG